MSWALIADSSCNLKGYEPQATDASFGIAPLKINVASTEYIDDDALDINTLIDHMTSESAGSSTACPSVGEWSELMRSADNVIVVPISSGLSGSLEAAQTARDLVLQEDRNRKIHIIDSRAAGGKLELLVWRIDRYLTVHPDACFDEVCTFADGVEDHAQVLYSLSTFDNLTKAGRLPKIAGAVVNKLNIRILGTATAQGTMKIVGPTRGEKKMYKKIVETMDAHGFHGGDVFIDHVLNEQGAHLLAEKIEQRWPESKFHIMPCRGLCSYYAEVGGLIIGYECSHPWE